MRDVLELGDEVVANVEGSEFRLYSQQWGQTALLTISN